MAETMITPAKKGAGVIMVLLILALLTLGVFRRVTGHDFLPYDDDRYVTGNPRVLAGLTRAGTVWAFTSLEAANWHPVTWLSHMADVQVFGPAPGRHHLVNLILHIANAGLLLLVLRAFTGALLPSAFVAALFAVHPLHVESVAWVAERKDLLSAFFGLLTLGAYRRYVGRPVRMRFLPVIVLFAAGLMAKPMLVTLPFLLLLLDWWPLGRIAAPRPAAPPLAAVLAEKVPLLILASASAVVTVLAQRRGMAIMSAEALPFGVRAANAVVSYARYLLTTVWPVGLAVFYPHPLASPPWWITGAAVAGVAGVGAAAFLARCRHPFFAVGWCWYLGTLVPVIGLVQVGYQSRADRYTYLPLIGLFIVVAWGAPRLCRGLPQRGFLLGTAAGVWLAVLMVLSQRQVDVWRNGVTLFEHALSVTRDNWLAHNNLGTIRSLERRTDEAVFHYREALRIKPDYATAQYNYANVLAAGGDLRGAATHLEEALRLNPGYQEAYDNLGNLLLRQGKVEQAIARYRKALELAPSQAVTHNNIATAFLQQGRNAEALSHLAAAVRLRPDLLDARVNLGLVLAERGRWEEAAAQFDEAVRLDPGNAFARFNRERAARAARERPSGQERGAGD